MGGQLTGQYGICTTFAYKTAAPLEIAFVADLEGVELEEEDGDGEIEHLEKVDPIGPPRFEKSLEVIAEFGETPCHRLDCRI